MCEFAKSKNTHKKKQMTKVVDSGPACWVEEDAGMPIIDATPLACEHFGWGSSCGYSDQKKLHHTFSQTKNSHKEKINKIKINLSVNTKTQTNKKTQKN